MTIDTVTCIDQAREGFASVMCRWKPDTTLPPFPFDRCRLLVITSGTWLEFDGRGSASVQVEEGHNAVHTAWIYGRQLALRRIRDDVRAEEENKPTR